MKIYVCRWTETHTRVKVPHHKERLYPTEKGVRNWIKNMHTQNQKNPHWGYYYTNIELYELDAPLSRLAI